MIRFKCYRGPIERLKIWLEQPHCANHERLEVVVDVMRNLFKVEESNSNNFPNRVYLKRARQYLLEKGETSAIVSFLRHPKTGRIARGGTRIPLKVRTKNGEYVIKPYDDYDSGLEKEVLKVVSGRMAPQVLHFGNDFYSEELVDRTRYSNLYDMAMATGAFTMEKRQEIHDYYFAGPALRAAMGQNRLAHAVEAVRPILLKGAEIHAELAKLGVIYDHNHWLDEFNIKYGGAPVVTDFGTSLLFMQPGAVAAELPNLVAEKKRLENDIHPAYSDEMCRRLGRVSAKVAIMEKFVEIYGKAEARIGYLLERCNGILAAHTVHELAGLKSNPALYANLAYARDSSYDGIERFFETCAGGSGIDYGRFVYNDFESAFFNRYFS